MISFHDAVNLFGAGLRGLVGFGAAQVVTGVRAVVADGWGATAWHPFGRGRVRVHAWTAIPFDAAFVWCLCAGVVWRVRLARRAARVRAGRS